MSTRHMVDPELLGALENAPNMEHTKESLPEFRTVMNQTIREASASFTLPLNVELSERMVPGPAGAPDVRVLVFQPKDGKKDHPAYLHIHGGGYIIGFADMSNPGNYMLAATLNCVVISVDYRLAPETLFPGPVEDCYAALKWLHDNAAELGVNKNRIAIGGESAGGGLAAGLALLARDRGEVPLIHQQLVYPMIEDRPPKDPHPHTGEFIWNSKQNEFGWTSYLGKAPGGKDVSPYAAAARAADVSGLPPTLLTVGALDLFLDEDVDYAMRLSRAGVPVELHVYPGAYHGFDMAFESRAAQIHAHDQLEALRQAFAPTG